MKLIRLLTFSQLKVNRSRMTLAFCSMLACVCLVVWLLGSFESLRGEFDSKAEQYMGNYDLYLSPSGPDAGKRAFSYEFIWELSNSPEVAQLDKVQQSRLIASISAAKYTPGDQPMRDRMGIPSINPILVANAISHSPYELEAGIWPDMSTTQEQVGVMGTASAELLEINLNDTLIVYTEAGAFPIKIVGLIEQSESTPDISSKLSSGTGPAFASLFVPVSVSEKVTGKAFRPNLLNIRLNASTDTNTFKSQWENQLREQKISAVFSTVDDLNFRLNDNRKVRGSKSQAYSAAGMVLLCCIFIIFTTLNMGVNERVRQLALLRAIGLTRKQIAAQIVAESFLLSIPAWIGGLVLGFGLLSLLHHLMPKEYPTAPQITGLTILFSALCSIGGGILASIIPAWRAAKTPPLDAIRESGESELGKKKFPILSTLAGLILLSLSPLILIIPGLEPELRKNLYSTVGYLSLFVGIICLAPSLIILTEKLFAPLLEKIFFLPRHFLAYQLTRQMSRTIGTVVSLSIGLGLFIAVQCWGYSMVIPFKPTKSVPDALVSFLPTGIPDDWWGKVSHVPGVKSNEFIPLALEQTRIAPELYNSPTFALIQQNNVLIAGIDIQKAFEQEPPLLDFRFVSGDKKQALEKLRQGHHILIPEGLSIATGLDVGDTIQVVPPKDSSKWISYTIAGVIDFPGWHWITKTSGMRRQEGGFTAGLLFTDMDTARADYQLDRLQFFWMNVEPGTDLRTGNKSPRKGEAPAPRRGNARPGGAIPGMGPNSQSGSLELAMQEIAEKLSGQELDISGFTGVKAQSPYAKVSSSAFLSNRIQGMADRAITQMSKLPLIGLALTTLALINTLMASVRVRSREFGILRSIGITRSALLRLVFGESLLIGLCAIILSLGFGIVAAWGSINLGRFGYVFGGIVPDLVIPWNHLIVGFTMTLGLCLLAALWPAIRLARRQPLDMLKTSTSE